MKYLARSLIFYAVAKRNTLVKPYLEGNVLDIGCGRAYLTNFVPMGNYTGIDANENKIQKLKKIKPGYQFHCIDADSKEGVLKLKSLNISFDTITLIAVVEHLRHPRFILEACSSHLLKEKGVLVITTPTPLGDKIGQLAFQIVRRESPRFPHIRLYALPDLEALLVPLGFKLLEYKKFSLGANQLFVYSKYS